MKKKKAVGILLAAAIILLVAQATTGAGFAAPGDIVYEDNRFNYALTLPGSWAGLYNAQSNNNGVSFINIHSADAGFGGFLFGIFIADNSEPLEFNYRQLTVSEGKYYFASFPTDVQFAYENKAYTDEYKTMENDIDSILKTFKLVPAKATAVPTSSRVMVDGRYVTFDAYTINNNNYFKLRDLAFVLSGTTKQFNVDWDRTNNAITLFSNTPYKTVGGEMTGKGSESKTAEATTSKIILDGKEARFSAYLIGFNNYFKLRDISKVFDFNVVWDGARNTIIIDTTQGYKE